MDESKLFMSARICFEGERIERGRMDLMGWISLAGCSHESLSEWRFQRGTRAHNLHKTRNCKNLKVRLYWL